ncbi:MAG: hypothetical protein EXR62_09300 [Chloroflexi bacterium]|nr:hypothetical protein [Chloroflexota bacterium]
MSTLFKLLTAAFGITLALIVVWQLTPDARALVLGLMLGLAAGVPLGGAGVWVIMASRQAIVEKQSAERSSYQSVPAHHQQQPVIVVQSPPPNPYAHGPYGGYTQGPYFSQMPPMLDSGEEGGQVSEKGRRFKVIGDDE